MKVTMKQIRMSAIAILATIALILAISEPSNQDTWYQDFFVSKALAAIVAYITYILATRWESKGLLPDMEDDDKWI